MKLKVLAIANLPKEYQDYYKKFVESIDSTRTEKAREAFRPLINFYTSNGHEIPPEIEMHYARLYLLEMQKEEDAKNS
jgi:intergrase/recombinase